MTRPQLSLMRGGHQQPHLTCSLKYPRPQQKSLLYLSEFRKHTFNLSSCMALRSVILFILSSLAVAAASLASAADEKLTAYQVLQQYYDFPAGILPQGVVGYDLNRETGEFSAYLNGNCNFDIDSYQLSYKSIIQGVISPGRIRNLKGVSVKILFFWVNIVEVIHDGNEMKFSVGIASANFPIDNFYDSPQCGCGFNCNAFLYSF